MCPQTDRLTPNGFPRAPDWGWDIRVAVFPGDHIDGGDLDLLELTDAQIREAVERYAARGVNFIQTAGFHARFMWIPYLERILELNTRITAAAHACGLRVYDHHSSNGLWREIEGTYRGWDPRTAVNVDIRTGLPLPQDKPKLMCINNPGYQENYDHYVLDYIARTGVDGLMYDDVHFHRGQYGCGCEHCRAKFAGIFGYELPRPGHWPLDDYADPVWRDWMRFRVISSRDRIVALRPKLSEDFLYFSCMSAGVIGIDDVHHGGGSFEGFAHGTNCLFSEGGALYFRNDLKWDRNFFSNWEQLYVEKKYAGGIAAHYRQPSLQMHYPANPDDGFFCWALTKCMGMNLWRCDSNLYGSPRYGDEFEEWTPAYDYLNWEAAHEDLWHYCRPVAEVGILFSLQSKMAGGADPQPHAEAFAGWAQTLQRAGIFWDTVVDPDLQDIANLARLKVLILPNALALSDRQLATVRDFVANGGQLVATHRTATLDETGAPRDDFGLADVCGVHLDSRPPTGRSSWYVDQRFLNDPLVRHLPPRLNIPEMLSVTLAPDATAIGWCEQTRRSFEWPTPPAVVTNTVGKGRVLYLLPHVGSLAYREGSFPLWHADPAREQQVEDVRPGESSWIVMERPRTPENARWLYVDDGSQAYRRLIENVVRQALPEPQIEVTGAPETLVVVAHRLAPTPGDTGDAGDRLLTFLNMTGADYSRGEWLPAVAEPRYPPIADGIAVAMRDPICTGATLYSPDLAEPLPLPVTDGQVRVPPEPITRVGFLRLTCSV